MVNPNEVLLYALKSDASPSSIKKILKKGASPTTTVDGDRIPIITYAQSPKAVSAVYKAISGTAESPYFLLKDKFGRTPLFYYKTEELCDAYINTILDNTKYGEYEELSTGKTITVSRESVTRDILTQKDEFKRTPIFYADSKKMIDYWLSKGNNLNDTDKTGANVLVYHIKTDNRCNIENLAYLIAKGADVNFGEENGYVTPLGEAFRNNRGRDIVDFLISKGTNVKNATNTSNLYYYVRAPEQVEFLKEKGLSPNIETTNGFFLKASNMGVFESIDSLFENQKLIAKSPLAYAIGINCNIKTLEGLLKGGADPAKSYYLYGNQKISVLRYSALALKNFKVTDLLLKYGAEKSFDIDLMLSYYVKKSNYKMLSMLFNMGVDPSKVKDSDALFKILLNNKDLINMKKMVGMGYNINKKMPNGRLLWRFLLDEEFGLKKKISDTEKLAILVDLGLDVNQQDEYGYNILTRLTSEMDSIKVNEIPLQVFKKIVENTSVLKDRATAKDIFKGFIKVKGIKVEVINAFLEKCPTIDDNALVDLLVAIFSKDIFEPIPDTIVISLINRVDNFNKKWNEKTMIAYAMENEDVSLSVIKAIAEKMYIPNMPTKFKYNDPKRPSEIAGVIGRDDIKDYLISCDIGFKLVDGKRVPMIRKFYLGMDKAVAEKMALGRSEFIKKIIIDDDSKKVCGFIFYLNEELGEYYNSLDEYSIFEILGIQKSNIVKKAYKGRMDGNVWHYERYMYRSKKDNFTLDSWAPNLLCGFLIFMSNDDGITSKNNFENLTGIYKDLLELMSSKNLKEVNTD